MEHRKQKITLGISILLFLIVTGVGVIRSVSGQSNKQNNGRSAIIEEAKQLPDASMLVNNLDQPPLTIVTANGKVIDGLYYQRLTGGKANASSYVTFPNLKLFNSSSLTIVRVTVYMKSKLIDEAHNVTFRNVRIDPGTEFQVSSKDWAGPRAKTEFKFTEKNGKYERANQELGLESEATWLPGNVQDYSIGLMSVEFENGTKWVAKQW